jgi:hypothetical protein
MEQDSAWVVAVAGKTPVAAIRMAYSTTEQEGRKPDPYGADRGPAGYLGGLTRNGEPDRQAM